MKYKALFLDLDGTVIDTAINKNQLPTNRVAQALAKIQNKLAVCIATGRPLYDAQAIIDHLSVTGLCVLNNGVQIYDPQTKKIVHEVAIDETLLDEIISACQKYDVTIHLFDGTKDISYTQRKTLGKILSVYIPNTTEKIVDALISDLRMYSSLATHKMQMGDVFFLEITNADASKLHGIAEVAKRLGIETHEIVGVGDSYNDFPLLLACGLRFAMGNAVPELKEIADFVAPSVENDGVAVIVEKFLLPLLS